MKRSYIIFHKDSNGKVKRLKSFSLYGESEHALLCYLSYLLSDIDAKPPTIVMSENEKVAKLVGPREWDVYSC